MPIGQVYTIKIHEVDGGDSTTVVFDGVTVKEFTHAAGFSGATTVVKEDFTGTPDDAFVVQVTYAEGSLPDTDAMTIDAMVTLAKNAVNNAFGDGEAGDPTAA